MCVEYDDVLPHRMRATHKQRELEFPLALEFWMCDKRFELCFRGGKRNAAPAVHVLMPNRLHVQPPENTIPRAKQDITEYLRYKSLSI